ncbi:Ankyrin repeat and KH domain-containing protein mask, partial [Gryllus bimaculatus]
GELYVPRRLQKGVAVRAAALRAPGLRDVFVVKEASREALQALVPPAERVQPLDRHAPDTRFVACRKMGWAKFRDAGADSDGGENPLLGFLEAEGEELENNAAFLKGCVSCTPFEEELAAAGVLVSGEPGAGKSEALRRVGRWLAERRAGDWVVRLSLADHADALAACGGECAATAAEALLRRAAGLADPAHAPGPAPTADDLLAGALLRDRLWETGRLRVLDSCVSSLWVSSREVMEDRLEAELRVRAFSLKPLSLADQEQFWVEYWSGPLGSTLPKETLMRKAKQLLHYLGGRFRSQLRLNIPLHTNIMANLFGRGFLSGNCEESLRHKDILYVYDKFVEMKFDIYCKEKASIVANSVVIKNLLNALHRDFMEKHKMCGLLESGIFDFLHPKVKQDICKNTEGFIADIQKGVEKTGIIVGVFCGKPRFIHRTFAEYFTARWIAEHHAENPGILDVLLERRFKSLKSVTDQLMSKQHELHRCVLNDDVDCLKEILLKNCVDIDAVDNGGRTALILAVQKNSDVGYEMSRHLLKKGVAVLGDREIYCAAKSQAWNNVKLLLDNGITLTNSVVRNEDVQNVLESAFSQNIITEEDKGVKDLDLNWNIFSNGRSILHLAIQCGAQESTDTLLEMGADPQSKDRHSNSPLHYAVLRHDEELVDKLLSRGAFIQQNIQGETPLFLACSLGLVPVVRKLLGHGASVNARSKTGSTLLHASVDHLDVMEILLQYEIDVDATDCRGFTVLHEATRRKKIDLISLLLKRGANVNCLNLQSQTPLLIAVANECISSATLLLKAGANVSDVTSSGNSPLHIAVGKKNILMTTLLLRNGADVNIQNHKGDSSVDLSRKLDVKEIQIVINSQTHKRTSQKSDEEKIVNGHPKTDDSPCQKGYWEEEEDEVDAKKKRELAQSLRSSQPVWSPDQAASPEAAALLSAIKRRNMRDVKAILVSNSKDASLWSARDSAGDSALHLAARTWTAEVVSLLLVHAPPEALAARNAAGDTPAHVAAARRLYSISLSLLASGADPCARNALGDTPLHVACRLAVYPQVRFVTPRLPSAALLARNDAGDSALHLALALGESKEEAQLLQPPPGATRATLLILYESKDVVSGWGVPQGPRKEY